MPLPILLALALGAQVSTDARDGNLSPALDACLSSGPAAQGVTDAMVDCMYAERSRQDVRLNARYRVLMRNLSPARGTALRNSERRWIARRDAHCGPILSESGGTIDRVNYASCLATETADRRAFLDRYPL